MSISAADVKRLRDMTNAPMMDCKAALEKSNGDMQKAAQLLREQNKAIAEKKGERETAEGRIATYIDPAQQVAAILELRCESAPVAKTDGFKQLADDLVKHVATTPTPPADVAALLVQPFDAKRTVKDRIEELVGLIRENMKVARFTRWTGGLFGSYVHFDGSVGVLLQAEASGGREAAEVASLLKDVCMHITAKQPAAARREDVAPALIEREKEIAKAQIAADPKNKNKPANILDKIIEGQLKAWYQDNILVEQLFVKDDTKTVGALLQNAGLTIKRFVRYKVGEVTGQ
jgi:elongation factor Ts